jgi:hypothetical protein
MVLSKDKIKDKIVVKLRHIQDTSLSSICDEIGISIILLDSQLLTD